MQGRIASALFVVFALLACAREAAAQASPLRAQTSEAFAEKRARTVGVQGLLKKTETGSASAQGTDSTKVPAVLPPVPKNIFDVALGKKTLLVPEPRSCAHIILFLAPNNDSEMVVEVPPGTGGNMPTVEAMPPCPHDFRFAMGSQQFPGIVPFPRGGPFLHQPFGQFRPLQPKKHDAPATRP